jgi:hypothetical protein
MSQTSSDCRHRFRWTLKTCALCGEELYQFEGPVAHFVPGDVPSVEEWKEYTRILAKTEDLFRTLVLPLLP